MGILSSISSPCIGMIVLTRAHRKGPDTMPVSWTRRPGIAAGWAVLALVLLSPLALAAQRPSARAVLDQFRDSLAQTSDVEGLASLEESLIEVAKRDRDNPLIHLKLGFVALRLGEIQGVSHSRKGTPFDDAVVEFEWAAELEPDWPYPWYGLGIAELGLSYLPQTAAENVRQHLGKDHRSKAANAFARAAEADPSYVPALTALTEVALAQKIKPKRELALAAARRAASSAAQSRPEVHLARARLEREVGSSDSSLVALQAYVATGGDAAVARFESAQALYDLGRESDGKDAYLDGAGNIVTTVARRLYRSDIEWIADSVELRSYDLEEVGVLRAWLTHFWTRRDARPMRSGISVGLGASSSCRRSTTRQSPRSSGPVSSSWGQAAAMHRRQPCSSRERPRARDSST